MADNNGTSIKVARFNGTEKLDIVERNEFGRCCLIKSAINVLEKLNVVNSTIVKVGADAMRKEHRLVNAEALREAVLNAIVHNDYINGAYPVFEIYDNRIEIVSSGGLPIGLSQDEFFEGRSLPRNKELMRIFSDMDLCEQLGSGMKKILKSYSKDCFNISEHFISVKFEYQNKNDTVNDTVNDTEKIILNLIKDNPSITISQLAKNTNKSRPTIARAIGSLKENGIIERVGSDKKGYWKILNNHR